MVVVRVEERAVDVKDGCGWHPGSLPAVRSPKRGSNNRPGPFSDPLKVSRGDRLKKCMSFTKSAVLVVAALAVLLLAVPSASAAGGCGSANATAAQASKRALVRATLCVLNAERARHRLRPLRLNRKLSRAALRHSRAMARQKFFSHTSPGGASFVDRIRSTGYLSGARSWAVGENIAYGTGSPPTPRSIGSAG